MKKILFLTTVSILLAGCAASIPTTRARYVDLNSLSGYDIQSVALGLIYDKPATTVLEKATVATFFTPDGVKKVDLLARLGKSKVEASSEFADIYDKQMKEKIESWYGVGFTYKTSVVIGREADVRKIYASDGIDINMDIPLLEGSPFTRDKVLETYLYTEKEAQAAKFQFLGGHGRPIERQLDSKYSGVEGTEDWRVWQIAIADTLPVKCKADYPFEKVQELISQGAKLVSIEINQSSTLTPFLKKRRGGQGPLLTFKVIDSNCVITNISKSR